MLDWASGFHMWLSRFFSIASSKKSLLCPRHSKQEGEWRQAASDLEMVGRHAALRDELRAGNEFGTNAPANSQLNNPKNTCKSRIAAIGWAF